MPVVSSGITNQGIIGRTDLKAKIIAKNSLTVDMFGYVFYRDFDYKIVTHARVFTLEPKESVPEKALLYIAAHLQYLQNVYSYTNMCSFSKINGDKLSLPITPSGAPDYVYMERYIKIQEKLAIKDAVLLKDRIFRETKEIVCN